MPDELSDCDTYLTDISERDKPWDTHRAASDHVKQLYQQAGYEGYSGRMQQCSSLLDFILSANDIGELLLRLHSAHFCRVRHCPTCQWRRSLMWRAKFFQALPKISEEYPTIRWVFLTLTVRNCPLDELRATLGVMGKAWGRMSRRKVFPVLGWVRSVEVTRSANGDAHPHYHCLLAVPASYFGKNYLKQAEWTELWKHALRVDYTPVVDVRAVKAKYNRVNKDESVTGLHQAICETLKYTIKESDLTIDAQWLVELTTQLHNTRAIATGGILKKFLSDSEPEDLIHVDGVEELPESHDVPHLQFTWREKVKRYAKK